MLDSINNLFARTKIIATLGPATSTVDKLVELIDAGMDIARVNFSHGSYEDHTKLIENIRKASEKTGFEIGILADLCGPKIRLGVMKQEFPIETGDKLIITTDDIQGGPGKIGTIYSSLSDDVVPGSRILIDDGLIELKVESINGNDIECVTVTGGTVKSRKGINLPGVDISAPALTEKDKCDVEFGCKLDVDFFALSFVRKPSDVTELREYIKKFGKKTPIVSKIEKPEAISEIIPIIRKSDAIMVARGDLGVEMKTEDVPVMQKMIIEKCRYYGKPAITATQMLDSMIEHPRPTRAEANDVANAVYDGTDAVMLSGETSVGKHPVKTLKIMDRIVRRAEERAPRNWEVITMMDDFKKLAGDLTKAACDLSETTYAQAILAITKSGRTAELLSKYRPFSPIIAFTESKKVIRRLSLYWGVQGQLIKKVYDTDTTIEKVRKKALESEFIKPGDNVIYVAGIPLESTSQVNMIKLEQIPGT